MTCALLGRCSRRCRQCRKTTIFVIFFCDAYLSNVVKWLVLLYKRLVGIFFQRHPLEKDRTKTCQLLLETIKIWIWWRFKHLVIKGLSSVLITCAASISESCFSITEDFGLSIHTNIKSDLLKNDLWLCLNARTSMNSVSIWRNSGEKNVLRWNQHKKVTNLCYIILFNTYVVRI